MRLAYVATASVMLLSLAACNRDISGTTATGANAVGATSSAPRASAQMPQSANSLPPGAAVSAPVATTTGVVGRTR